MKLRLFVLLLTASLQVAAQEKKQWQPFLVFDSYYSFIGNRSADVWGFRGGVVWNDEWRIGAGYNKLRADIIEQKKLPDSELSFAKNDTVKAQLYLQYFPLMAEYIAYRKDPWQISVPLQLGYGTSYFEYFDRNNNRRRIFEHGVLVFQPGINAQYKVLKWFGLGAGIGYRLVPVNNPKVETKMNSPVFAIGLKIYVGEIVKSVREGE
jgi:hypothetical protein